MDILSHALWGGVAFGRKLKRNYWLAFLFGLLPDFVTFTPLFVGALFGYFNLTHLTAEASGAIPSFVYILYNLTHSLIIFSVIFLVVWIVLKKPFIPLLALPLHIILDIFTHGVDFFPTPFLWPVSNFAFDGTIWTKPIIFLPNVAGLILVYGFWYFKTRRKINY
ncbi:MAG: hypothetical protein COT91_02965 [Candidatus Doudnabacteria bacterium CG10_big_fil_rev_8_21_14_0_10_41_10]|uniref:Metal-dependent hydrolase n=1 Tax=Candidatus Doudnabacteria bacterium CG10_big_fil_rev_8_21_14_0_10_41_10 TaxID=1974551 RepID=A0A2H0VDJ7_9BACT|nr:MAG: hypothetical protein COT91_02965 [Candidatus Doudnabacteria bacterium CG10_big_fil_rev_8_21_14_0_10_41_10]